MFKDIKDYFAKKKEIKQAEEREKEEKLQAKKKKEELRRLKKSRPGEVKGIMRAFPVILVAVALFITLCFITGETGAFGSFIAKFFKGLFSYMAYTIPVFVTIHAMCYFKDVRDHTIAKRIILSVIALITLSEIAYLFAFFSTDAVFNVSAFYNDGINGIGGGFIGNVFGFVLRKIFGKLGLAIILALTVIIYIICFFLDGSSKVSTFLLKKLTKVVNYGASLERKSQEKKKKQKLDKLERQRAVDDKKNADFYNDEFFYADNGVSRLEIPELGILETKNALNENNILRETVIKSTDEPKGTVAEEPAKKINLDFGASYESDSPTFVRNESKQEGYRSDDIIYEEVKTTPETTASRPMTAADYGIDDSADAIFTANFDPFDIALNEKMAAKQSSKASEMNKSSNTTYSEFLRDVTPESIEQINRNREFEARKQEALKRKEAMEAMRNANAQSAPVESSANADVAERNSYSPANHCNNTAAEETQQSGYTVRDSEPVITGTPIAEDKSSQNISNRYKFVKDTIEEEPRRPYATSDGISRSDSQPTQSTSQDSSARLEFTVEEREAPATSSFTFDTTAKNEYRTVASQPIIEDRSNNEYSAMKSSNDEFTLNIPTEKCESTFEEKTLEFEASDNTVNTVNEIPTVTPALDFDVEDTDLTSDETFEITRTPVSELLDNEDVTVSDTADDIDEPEAYSDEDDIEICDGDGEEIIVERTEIPENEQNPKINEYRSMFTVLNDSNSAETADVYEDDEPAPEESNSINFIPKGEALPFEEDDLDEDDETDIEDDEPPFDMPIKKVTAPEKPKSQKPDYSNYKFPPIDLLKKGQEEDTSKITDEIQLGADQLINTLDSFNIKATVRGIERGPRITRYSIVPAKGVRVNQIEKLSDDISLAMAAESIRIEAPIPGKSAVGIEVPNKVPSLVSLRDLLESDEFQNEKSKTYVCIGKSVEGSLVFGDIGTMPHLLIAGATGMGKSVCMNSLITSILYKARPDEVKFIMIDPKKVEFAPYNGIPHLLVPVVTDPKQAAGALLWAVDEMNKRYEIIEKLYVRNIDAYNDKVAENPELGAPMSKIIIFIDELNDLMIQVRDPVENLIMLIAQKARAAGIHLVIGTQRPSVNVITGVIKANIPSRIACKVSSGIDSRTILEQTGAEKLIGKGDMLFAPGGKPNPKRVQGAYVSDLEAANIVEFVKNQAKGNVYDEQALEDMKRAAQKCDKSKDDDMDDDDDGDEYGTGYLHDRKFLNATELAIRNGSVATSFLQRKLHIGYGKAAQYIDIMEDLGIVGEKNGSKARDVLISMDEWKEKLARLTDDDY